MTEDELKEIAERSNTFLVDMFPQLGKICVQDLQNLNELAILLTKFKKSEG